VPRADGFHFALFALFLGPEIVVVAHGDLRETEAPVVGRRVASNGFGFGVLEEDGRALNRGCVCINNKPTYAPLTEVLCVSSRGQSRNDSQRKSCEKRQ